ncbi:E-selectin [Myotis brandtii]|uniref:E-selectin n=1 Tax=Myotis brandtii TaxID=109478 RepID=S7MKD9_MYOBR|nr:E-selectin [Myotis brandtii]
MTFDEASTYCQQHYTHLVAIQNQEEIQYLDSILKHSRFYYWIGIRKVEGQWVWIGTGKPLTEEAANWAPGEPNNKRANEDCVEIYIKRQQDPGKWNDELCSKRKRALCYTAACTPTSCSGHGDCVETINNYTCQCHPGFRGLQCEQAVTCPAQHAPEHGRLECTQPWGSFSYNASCTVSCEEGYRPSSPQAARCTASGEWSAPLPGCEVAECPEVARPAHGSVDCSPGPGAFPWNTSCAFYCEEGFALLGAPRLRCTASGHWDHEEPTCTASQCKAPSRPERGHVSCAPSASGSFQPGASCAFSCEPGFVLKGRARLQCGPTGQWDSREPTCEVAECPEVARPAHGSVDCSPGPGAFPWNTSCAFYCEEGFALLGAPRLRCTASGHWDHEEPTCTVVQCSHPEVPSKVAVSCDGDLVFGAECTFTCPEGWTLNGSAALVCGAAGHWSGMLPTCEAPAPSSLPLAIGLSAAGTSLLTSASFLLWLLKRLRKKDFSAYHGTDGWTYHHSEEPMNWPRARRYCQQNYTDLVAIQNKGEIEYLNRTLPFRSTYYWIGIRKVAGVWTWVGTNKSLTAEAENWGVGEPNNKKSKEDCVEMYIKRSKDAGKWNDDACHKPKVALCYTVTRCAPLEGPELGAMACSHPLGDFSYSSRCAFNCSEGTELAGAEETTCGPFGNWSSLVPTCRVIPCDALTAPDLGTMDCHHPLDNFSFNSTCTFNCLEGTELIGKTRTVCESSGIWSSPPPICQELDRSFSMIKEGDYNPLFIPVAVMVTAFLGLAFIIWLARRLKKVIPCDALTAPDLGTMDCHHPLDNFSFNSTCTFNCLEGTELIGKTRTVCESSGIWSSPPPICQVPTIQQGHGARYNDDHFLTRLLGASPRNSTTERHLTHLPLSIQTLTWTSLTVTDPQPEADPDVCCPIGRTQPAEMSKTLKLMHRRQLLIHPCFKVIVPPPVTLTTSFTAGATSPAHGNLPLASYRKVHTAQQWFSSVGCNGFAIADPHSWDLRDSTNKAISQTRT